MRLSMAMEIPISATRLALERKNSFSCPGSPYSATNIAPDTLNRSVIVEDIAALRLKESRVKA